MTEDEDEGPTKSTGPDVVDLSHLPHAVGYAVVKWAYCDEIDFRPAGGDGSEETFVLGVMSAAGNLHLKQLMNRYNFFGNSLHVDRE
jgi:hypothetical protein